MDLPPPRAGGRHARPRLLTRSVGVDVGGTFTDLVALDEQGSITPRKVVTTPADQSGGVEAALRALGNGTMPTDVARIVHGTTVATNMLLERAGARVVLCATAGFTDLLELRRQSRASLFDLTAHHSPALVARDDVIGVDERIAPQGIVRPLTAAEVDAVASKVVDRSPAIVAIALLHSYADRRHEDQLAGALAKALPAGVDVVRSVDVFPEIREYERTATTVAEAYLRPGVARYLDRLADRLDRAGLPHPGVMTSNGGTRRASEAARGAASLALSGPAGGVVGAASLLGALGIDRALTIDIGGTSADVGLVLDGSPLVEGGGSVAGAPIALPRVLVETVSAGGGSIAWVDDGGALRVGPRSAGVEPGPAAFGRGGVAATVTDAHIVLGTIGATRWPSGITLDERAARRSIEPLAERLDATVVRVAEAIVATVDATMARALRRVSVERGIDPRRCTLVAFGGGGPLHACGLAEHVGIERIVVPPFAGVLSAVGLASAPERRDGLTSMMRPLESITAPELGAILSSLHRGVPQPAGGITHWWLHTRYVGQGHEVDVPVTPDDAPAAAAERFAALHQARFGFTLDRAIEVVSARVAVVGPSRPVRWAADEPASAPLRGPATVPLPDATMLVKSGWTARPTAVGGWLLERDA